MLKIKFREYPDESLTDWTPHRVLSRLGTIKRSVESENAGEAGVIRFDKVSSTFYYKEGNVVYNKYEAGLTSANRHIYEIYGLKNDRSEVKMFEGIADFGSLSWPDLGKKMHVSIVDKLSALKIIDTTSPRNNTAILHELNTDTSVDTIRIITDSNSSKAGHKWFSILYEQNQGSSYLTKPTILENTPEVGSIIRSPFDQDKFSLIIYKGKKVTEINDPSKQVFLDVITFDESYPNTTGITKRISNLDFYSKAFYNIDITIKEFRSNYSVYYKSGGSVIEIPLQSGYEVVGFDAVKIIEAIVKQAWSDVVIINRSGTTQFPLPVNYFNQLLTSEILGKHPYDALKQLADSMMCYIFFDREGRLIIQKKEDFENVSTIRSIAGKKKISGNKKFFWNKIVDGVSITAINWMLGENGENITSTASITKNANIKPKNVLEKEIYLDKGKLPAFGIGIRKDISTATNDRGIWEPGINYNVGDLVFGSLNGAIYIEFDIPLMCVKQHNSNEINEEYWTSQIVGSLYNLNYTFVGVVSPQDCLYSYAYQIAQKYFNFYGNRHYYYNLELDIDDDVIDWDILDVININGDYYFIESMSIDLIKRIINFDLVSVQSFNYDYSTAQIPVSQNNKVSAAIATTFNSGSAFYGLSPYLWDGGPTGLNPTLARQSIGIGSLDPIEYQFNTGLIGIKYTSKFKLTDGKLDLSDEALIDPTDEIEIAKLGIGMPPHETYLLAVAGSGYFQGDVIIDGDIYLKGFVDTVNERELNIEDHTIRLNKGGDDTTALNGGIELLGTNNNIFSSIKFDGYYWNISHGINLAANKFYRIDSTEVLSKTSLGNSVVSSNLQQVGILESGSIAPGFGNIDIDESDFYGNNITLAGVITQLSEDDNYFSGDIQHPSYVSQLNNWRITKEGAGDFRYLYADEMHIKSFIADLEQALAGSQIIAKSVAIVAQDFTLPIAGGNVNFKVESFPGYPNARVFADNDFIRFRQFSRTDGSLIVADAWGQVSWVSTDTTNKTQTYTFTRSQNIADISAAGNASGLIEKGQLVIDYGTSGNGYYEVSAIDGHWGENSPYARTVTWEGHPAINKYLKTLFGNLNGISDPDFPNMNGFGLYAVDNVYIKGVIKALAGGEIAAFDIYNSSLTTDNFEIHGGTDPYWLLYENVNSDFIVSYYTDSNNWGLQGWVNNNKIFSLGSENKISAWGFDETTLSNGDVRLEASVDLKGLAVTSNNFDVVKVGDFVNTTESYLTTSESVSTNFTETQNSHSPNFGIINNGSTSKIGSIVDTSWNQVQWIGYKSIAVTNVKGKTISFSFDVALEETSVGDGKLNVFAMIETDSGHYGLRNITPDIVQSLPATNFDQHSVVAIIPSNASYARLRIHVLYNNIAIAPGAVVIKNVACSKYIQTVTELNKKGLRVYQSPIQRIDLRDATADFDVSRLRTSNQLEIGDWKFVQSTAIDGSGNDLKSVLQLKYKNNLIESWTS